MVKITPDSFFAVKNNLSTETMSKVRALCLSVEIMALLINIYTLPIKINCTKTTNLYYNFSCNGVVYPENGLV
jgi:hypothetical protein